MFIQENLTTTPHEVPGVSWELPEALAGKLWAFGAFAKLVLSDDRTAVADIVEDSGKRAAAEAAAATEARTRAAQDKQRAEREKAQALWEQGARTLTRILFRQAAPAMAADEVIECRALADEWGPGVYAAGDVRMRDGVPYRCCQAHDSSANPDWRPGNAAALWAPYHGTTPETALPWVAPTGAHDLYRAGECMAWTDGRTMRAVQDTSFSPGDFPGAWEEVTA